MSDVTIPDYPKNVTFEQVWAMMQETDRMIKELSESQKETEQMIKENAKEARERSKAIDKKISDLGSRFGEMTEYMVVPNLVKKFHELGFIFEKTYLETEIKDKTNHTITEVDITLENGDKVMIVEVKTKPSIDDVKDHIERMEKVRDHAHLHGDKRKFLGAIAGLVIKENIQDYILKNGFYVIQPSDETFIIIPPEGEAKEW
jgi:hypothetical protein